MTAPSEPTSILSPGIRPVTISILLAMGLVAFDTLSVITMLPAITADLGHVELLSWIVTAFLLTSTITILVAGPIIDRWGLRVTFHVSLVILVAASIGASVAPTMELLVISRAVQGIGGGAALTVSFAAIGIAIPQGLRTQSYAANAAVWGVASLAGPGVAAALISFASWRLVFLLNVPLGLAAFLVSSRHLPGRRPGAADGERLDARGVLLVAMFTAAVLVALADLSRWSLFALAVGAGLGVAYWRHAGRVPHPILRRDHVVSVPMGVVNLLGFAALASALAVIAYTALFVEGSLGLSTAHAGLSIGFSALGWTVGSTAASRLQRRISGYSVITGGLALVSLTLLFGLVVFDQHSPFILVLISMLTITVGVGGFSNAQFNILHSLTEETEMGRVSSSVQYLRSLGNSCGTAAAGALIVFSVARRVGDPEKLRDLLAGKDVNLGADVRIGLAAGYRLVHLMGAAIAVVGLAGSIALGRHMARRPSDGAPSSGAPSSGAASKQGSPA